MVRIAIIVVVALVALLGIAQLAIPVLAEKKIEDRLTQGGGSASATVDAFPAALLLLGDGDSVTVSGSDLDIDVDSGEFRGFDRLDGFDTVDVDLRSFHAGPFEVDSFQLSRDGSGPYALRSSLATTGAALASYGADRLGVPGASLIPLITGTADDSLADKPVPVELDMELTSDDGRITVTSGGGTVAGFPTGPLAELITQAIVVQL
jgi:hypothetical protein